MIAADIKAKANILAEFFPPSVEKLFNEVVSERAESTLRIALKDIATEYGTDQDMAEAVGGAIFQELTGGFDMHDPKEVATLFRWIAKGLKAATEEMDALARKVAEAEGAEK